MSAGNQVSIFAPRRVGRFLGRLNLHSVHCRLQLTETKADKVMAGRALAARPWMMWQLGEKLGFESPEGFEGIRCPQTLEEEGLEYGKCLLRFIDYCEEDFIANAGVSESLVLRKVLFYIRTTHVWLEFGHALMALSTRAKNLNELRVNVAQFFQQEQRMYQRTELRQ